MNAHTLHSRWMSWLVCLSAALFFFYEFIQGNMFASIADNIMRDFNIEADKMTYLSSIYYVSNVLFLFVSCQLLDRFSAKKIILIAMLFCVLSTFVLANAHSLALALLCRFITGIGSAFCFLGPIRIATAWFLPKQMAFVTGIIVTMAMSGGLLAQYPLTKLVISVGWRAALVDLSWLGLVMLGIISLIVQDAPQSRIQRSTIKFSIWHSMQLAYCNFNNLFAAIFASLMNMGIAVFGAIMGSLYLIQRLHIAKESAALINMMLFVGAIIGGPVMGFWSDKIGVRLLPMKVGALVSLCVILCILYVPVTSNIMAILFFLLGFFTAAQVISYALVAENSAPEITATALSMVSILTQGGYILYQNIFSWILSWHGHIYVVDSLPVYPLSAYQSAAILLPIGLSVAFILLTYMQEHISCK